MRWNMSPAMRPLNGERSGHGMAIQLPFRCTILRSATRTCSTSPGAMQWATDLIGYDAQKPYASPSYWAQSLFAEHLGDGTARSAISGEGKRFFYSATVSSADKILHLKLVNASNREQPLSVHLSG